MLHKHRTWQLASVSTAEELAEKLADYTWCGCQAFFVDGHPDYLFLNDTTSAGGAQEYAVIRRFPDGRLRQIESITFSWCSTPDALRHITDMLAGKADSAGFFPASIELAIEPADQHGRCPLCM